MTKKVLLASGVAVFIVSAIAFKFLYNTGDFDLATVICEMRQDPTDGGKSVFYTQQIRALKLRRDAGILMTDGGFVLPDGGTIDQRYPQLTGSWVMPDPLIDDDSTPIRCIEVADDPTLDAGARSFIQGLCACSPYLPDGGHPAACQWDMTDGTWTKAPGGVFDSTKGVWQDSQTLAAGHWRGTCVQKICVVLDGDQGRDTPNACSFP